MAPPPQPLASPPPVRLTAHLAPATARRVFRGIVHGNAHTAMRIR